MAKKKKATKAAQRKNKNGESLRILISRTRLQKRITEIAREIRKDFPDEPLHLVGVLKGAVFFLTDLGKQIPGEVSFDFIAVSSYGSDTHTLGAGAADTRSGFEHRRQDGDHRRRHSGHRHDAAIFAARV